MKNTELDHRTRSLEKNLLMHMLHAMLVDMICFYLSEELLEFYLQILEHLSHMEILYQ